MNNYNLELNKIIKEIQESNPKTVIIQLPDGLKPKAKEITDKIQKQTNIKPLIWLGSCFGACDIPNFKADLLIQFGHSAWK